MQSTILTLQQQLKGVKNELVEEKQSSEKHVEQIRVLERNLDLARTQPPSPVEGGKQTIFAELNCDNTDRTEADEVENETTEPDVNEKTLSPEPTEVPKEIPKIEDNPRTPPRSAFSISQILGEPKRTPSPDIPPGGDAVVTKLPCIGGYSDLTGELPILRTDASGLLNGEGKESTPPLVT